MAKIPIYFPTFISSVDYKPAVVNPRIFFYNGKRECNQYYFLDANDTPNVQQYFPYFDHYSAGTGSTDFPTSGSYSLLFQNENSVYGVTPAQSLYTTYWDKYVSLLYNPRTRLINCKGIIPLAVYFETELNDIISWKGNLYHLRAINNYDLKTGKCDIQLLGPILPDSI